MDEVIICFHNGDAEARGKVKLPAVGDIPVVGMPSRPTSSCAGHMDLSGDHPQIVITDIEAGNLPKKITDQVEDQVVDIINGRLDDLNLSAPIRPREVHRRRGRGQRPAVAALRHQRPLEYHYPVHGHEAQLRRQPE